MKQILFYILFTILSASLFAQEDTDIYNDVKKTTDKEIVTILGNKKLSFGGYGAFSVNYSQIDKKDALLIGGRGSWLIGHWFGLGIGGNGFFNDYTPVQISGQTRDANLTGGYGGLVLEPIVFPNFPVHLSLPVLIGAGGIAYTTSNYYPEYDDSDYFVEDSYAYFIIEPGVELELNMLKFFRLAFGGYYRYTSDIDLIDYPENVLHGFSGGITFKFGKF